MAAEDVMAQAVVGSLGIDGSPNPRIASGASALLQQMQRRKVCLAVLLIVAIGLPLRLLAIATPFTGYYSWNEAHYTMIARNFGVSGPLVQYDDFGLDGTTTPLVPWAIALSQAVFGPSEWAARLPILVCGLLTLWLFFLLARRLYGHYAALVALALAVVTPDIVYFSRNVQLDAPQLASVMAACVALLRYRQVGRQTAFAAFLAALCLAWLCKWTTLLFLPLLGALWIWQPDGATLPRRLGPGRVMLAVVLPVLPAGAWILWSLSWAPAYERFLLTLYFNRSGEWSRTALVEALKTIFHTTVTDFNVTVILLLLGLPWIIATWRRHLPALLAVCSFLPELCYPVSFGTNIYYLYPAYYGVALLCGAVAIAAVRAARAFRRQQRMAIGMVAIFLLVGGLDAKHYVSFLQQNTGRSLDPVALSTGGGMNLVALARTTARVRRPDEKVLIYSQLAVSPQMMYYAGGRPNSFLSLLSLPYGYCLSLPELLGSHFYSYVLFDLQPSAAVDHLLRDEAYRPESRGFLWRLSVQPAHVPQFAPWMAVPRNFMDHSFTTRATRYFGCWPT